MTRFRVLMGMSRNFSLLYIRGIIRPSGQMRHLSRMLRLIPLIIRHLEGIENSFLFITYFFIFTISCYYVFDILIINIFFI
jgi:hypothetical protein